jgi:predicted nucleic acid-binding protein
VDSCVLIDVLADDPQWAEWSLSQLDLLGQQAPLIINPIILAEVSPRFERASDLEAALAPLPLVREALPWDAAFLAGQAFKVYRGVAGTKTSPMPDFYIGAHALVGRLRLLTRDAARYRSYFPKLSIVSTAGRKHMAAI